MRTTLKVNGKAWNSTPAIRQRLNRWLPKLAGVTTSRISTLCKIALPGFAPHICEVVYQMFTRLVFIFIFIRGFCPPHMRSCLPNVHSASFHFLGSSNWLPLRPLSRFWRSIHQKTSFRARMCLLGVPRTNFHIFVPFSPKTQIFGRFSTGQKMSTQNAL